MKLAMVQMSNSGTLEKNIEKSISSIKAAAESGADLVLFPEVQLTEFFPQYEGLDVKKYGIELNSEIINMFRTACRENRVYAVPNVYLLENGRYFDASLVIDCSGEIIGVQKMVHIAQAKQFYEQDYYTPADDGFKVFDTDFGKIGIVVCFDRHYPESIRTEALMGAELILIPTVNTKQEPMEMFDWEIRVQAFQSCVAAAMCNRVGTEGEMNFSGESLAVNAEGQLIIKADDSEQIVYAEIDLPGSSELRKIKPYTSLRRTELYV